MSIKAFESRALSEALRERIAGRCVLAAVFTTYTFDPRFFELEVLPLLFSRSFSKEKVVKVAQLDEALRTTPVEVYFDRAAVSAADGGGTLGVRTFGIRRTDARGQTKGCFHPKLCLLLLQETESDEQALLVAVMSANLTQTGHWSNVECVWLDEMNAQEPCSYQKDLLKVLTIVRNEANPLDSRDNAHDAQHIALDRVRKFVSSVTQSARRIQDGWFQSRLFYGQTELGAFLRDELSLPPDTYHLEIISPFFDDGEALKSLVEDLRPVDTRVYLPLADDNSAVCEQVYFETVRNMPNVQWSRFDSQEYLKRNARDPNDMRRSVHAKVYRLWSKSEAGEFLVLGSVNLTKQAHSVRRSGNFEVAVVLENRAPVLQRFLVPIDQAPTEFGVASELTDEAGARYAEACPLLLRFHWKSRTLEGLWDATSESPRIELVMSGARLPEPLEKLPVRVWTKLPHLAGPFAEHLSRTSLVQVDVAGAESSWIIVQEHDLLQKPTQLCHLTVEEILRYWSALSDAQRQALLERAEVRHLLAIGKLEAPLPEPDGMFDRFAGVFHAFERLREHIEKAISEGNHAEAEYRLFGSKHDSLPHLLERLLNENKEPGARNGSLLDASTLLAVRYATYLSAQRLLRQLEHSSVEFLGQHAGDVKSLQSVLDQTAVLRDQVIRECEGDGAAFVDWFDDWFLGKRDRGAA